MIKKTDYMKSISQMEQQELGDLAKRISTWSADSYPRLCSLVTAWEEADVKDYDEGLKLASALRSAHSFIEQAYQFSVNSRLKHLNGFLNELLDRCGKEWSKRPATVKEHVEKMKAEHKERVRRLALAPTPGQPDEDGVVETPEPRPLAQVKGEVDGTTLDSYIPYLTPELKEEAKNIHHEYLLLTKYRQQVESLVDNPDSDKQDRAAINQLAVRQSDKIENFWQRVHICVSDATGKPLDDDMREQIEKEAEKLKVAETRNDGEYTYEEIELMDEGEEKARLKRARILANKNYMRRKDITNDTKGARAAELRIRMRELKQWGEKITPMAKQNCLKAGIPESEIDA